MSINERGEFQRESDAPDVSGNPELEESIRRANELAANQDQEPESDAVINAKKKAEMKRRLLGE